MNLVVQLKSYKTALEQKRVHQSDLKVIVDDFDELISIAQKGGLSVTGYYQEAEMWRRYYDEIGSTPASAPGEPQLT
jgi:hypothetical protein